MEALEPALELCMKIQRSTGDNGKRSKIRVVTPQSGPYIGDLPAVFRVIRRDNGSKI